MGIKKRLWERFRPSETAATKISLTVLANKKMVAEEDEELREFFLCQECSRGAHISNMYPKSRMNGRSVGQVEEIISAH